MLLADTSVWVDHIRASIFDLEAALSHEQVLIHPFVVGELACGTLNDRGRTLEYLLELPLAVSASNDEVLELVEGHRLWGRGVGWIDLHLIASAILSDCRLWTRDKRQAGAAEVAGVKLYPPEGPPRVNGKTI